MNFYHSAFIFLTSSCGLLTWQQYRKREEKPDEKRDNQPSITPRAKVEAREFQRLFLTVYCLVMAADWLQGPYVYSLYRDQFGLGERVVGLLFMAGFLSGAISGYFAGQFTDAYGRKSACLIFCIIYSTACFSTLVPSLPILLFGRVCSGLSTSLMVSAFESWMVTEYHKRRVDQAGISLGNMYGIMQTLNSIVAIISGVFSEWIVQMTGTKRAPFMASAGLLGVAFWVIGLHWTENYGDSRTQDPSASNNSRNQPPPPPDLRTILTDKRILALGLASCIFEGSMYLFVFFWSPALHTAHTYSPTHNTPLPLGLIFASFMTCSMLGSLIFSFLSSPSYASLSPSRLLSLLFATASSSLLLITMLKDEKATFWAFCVFEICVGMYWPSIGTLKSRVVEDGVRARIYGILMIPSNVFVVVALALIKEGEEYRNGVFLMCGGLLVLTSGVFHWTVRE
ncbi:hypothetical protein HYFRA_00007935 [Hymenoscyphus fraxineus]|uniref:Molybdate-anion transporter n=1 Tax=Hymenoscyphus fraxineus TaxID=746836 RepID=A0A9N9PQ44_9HELO|nr:hypothetical protein HYFRA_00007935 [Hymenoscyphus fraxineus]